MRLIDADILIAELKESASHHCNNPREDSLLQRDRVIVRAQPTVEAIPKADYENRLKADMVAMLTDFLMDIEENTSINSDDGHERNGKRLMRAEIIKMLEDKINSLKEVKDGKEKVQV